MDQHETRRLATVAWKAGRLPTVAWKAARQSRACGHGCGEASGDETAPEQGSAEPMAGDAIGSGADPVSSPSADSDALAGLGAALGRFLRCFSACFGRVESFKHFERYCRGLLAAPGRRTAEAIALEADAAVRTVQEFLTHHRWDEARLNDQIQQRVAQKHVPVPGAPPVSGHDAELGSIGIFDGTSEAKKGEKTPGVQRQYLGCLGKVDNGIVTVHLAYTHGDFQTLIDRDLFLPDSWSEDRARCRAAHVPEDKVHEPQWQLALNQYDRARANGVRFDWLTFDEGFGRVSEFLFELEARGQWYLAEVPRNFYVWGRKPKYRSQRAEFSPSKVEHIARWSSAFLGKPWHLFAIERKTREAQHWQVRAAPVYRPTEAGPKRQPSDRTYWLIHAHQPVSGEEKYFLSNAPMETPLQTLVRVAFSRAKIEHLFRIGKQELGLFHYEGRNYRGLMRHLTLGQLMMLFVAEQTERRRKNDQTRAIAVRERDISGLDTAPTESQPYVIDQTPITGDSQRRANTHADEEADTGGKSHTNGHAPGHDEGPIQSESPAKGEAPMQTEQAPKAAASEAEVPKQKKPPVQKKAGAHDGTDRSRPHAAVPSLA